MSESAAILSSHYSESRIRVDLPDGWLSYDGFKKVLQVESKKKLRVTMLEDGGAEFSKVYRYEAIKMLREVYPRVIVNTTALVGEPGSVKWCGPLCQEAKRDLCECVCDGENHGGGYQGDLPVILVETTEEDISNSHTYTSDGLPKVGEDRYYMAELFGDEYLDEYLAWRTDVLRERVRFDVMVRAKQLAKLRDEGWKLTRWRMAKEVADAGYGVLTKSSRGKPSNAEEILVDYVVNHFDGDFQAAFN